VNDNPPVTAKEWDAHAKLSPRELPPDRTPEAKKAVLGIVTVNANTYFQPVGRPGKQISTRYDHPAYTTASLYEKEIVVREAWQPLDVGGVEECSLMVLQNPVEQFYHVLPSAEDRRAADARVVEVAFTPPDDQDYGDIEPEDVLYEVPPGRGAILTARNLSRLVVRCKKGVTRINLFLFPK
jgi:hypothetical protein